MASGEQIYHGSVRVLAFLFMAVGAAMIVLTLAGGGGPLSVGVVLGLAFLAVGAGRLWLARRMGR